MTDGYYTVKKRGIGEIVEKKSKFIATVIPVVTNEEALAEIEALRSKYWDARHNVYAYTLLDGQMKRYSDDGEPSGTAGMPILNVLEKEELKNVLVVVTRYFGGILLGTGGLVRAYSAAAKAGIDESGIVRRTKCSLIQINCAYPLLGKIQNYVAAREGAGIKDVLYTDAVSVSAYQTADGEQAFIAGVTELTDGKAQITVTGTSYEDFDKI